MPTIILISILIQAASGYLFGPSKVTGALGGSVMVSCYYNPISANIYGRKFWCKMSKDDCFTIISTKNYINQNYINRTNLQKYTDHFKINMTNLQQKDNGIYRCGIGNNNGRFYYTVNVTVSEGNKIPYSSEVIIANLKSSITINCPVIQEQGTGWKYWCKMHHQMDVPSCHTMVNSSGYVHENFWGRVLIQEVYNTSDFKILVNNIKMNDFGFYRCGTGKFEDGSDWTDIHIHILNPSETIRYRIIKPRSRSPGELAVAQCQVPKSFHTVFLVYWCRWNETGCLRLIDSNGFIQKGFQNRVSLNNTNRTYIMSLAQLELGDSGYYWCVITDGQNMQTSSVEVHVIAPTTTEIYLSSISRHTRGNSLTATTYSTDRPSATESHINITPSLSSLKTLTATLNLSHNVLTTKGSKSSTEQDFCADNTWQPFITTARYQTGGASIAQLTADPTPATNSIHTTWHQFITTARDQTGGASVPTLATNSIQESTSTTSKNYETGNIVMYTRSFQPTNTDSGLNHSTPIEQDFYAENTTRQQFITTARHHTGGASIVPLTADPTPPTNSIQESTSTTSKNSVTGNIAEYTRAFLPTNTDTSLTHSTTIKQETTKELYTRTSGRWHNRSKVYTPFIPILTTSTYQESHINITPSPSSLKTLTATLNLSHNVLTTKGSKSSTEQDFCADNTTWHQFITTARDQTGGASVPTLATNSIQGMDYSGNITPHSTHTMSETEENYGISHGYKLNSEVTILLENSTVETQSKPGHNGSRYQSQNPKNLILILFPVLAISCVIGFATLIYVVKNVRKKREATDNSVHHQENLFMRDREPAKEEISEESEILTHELAKYNNVFKETEV
ncbi:uncharacterized protein LOC130356435 isoform X1 [Hyla sarda]|uniref:uncharacterized protein LOC130356435 isoform X1 n=1 Tax=Hyla sarda TaxID=327740 RepID=UPI0024C3B759|nr:uncharacterized protein LOC130356435 isoform X1 [Hyla sarda]